MTKNYEIPENKPCMVSEAAIAYNTHFSPHTSNFGIFENRGSLDSAISGEELKSRLHESLRSRFV